MKWVLLHTLDEIVTGYITSQEDSNSPFLLKFKLHIPYDPAVIEMVDYVDLKDMQDSLNIKKNMITSISI